MKSVIDLEKLILKGKGFFSEKLQEDVRRSSGLEYGSQKTATEKFLLTFPNKLGWSKAEFAQQIELQLINWDTRPLTGRSKTRGDSKDKLKSWCYLVEENYRDEGKHIHAFIFLKGETTEYIFIQDFFAVTVNNIELKAYTVPIKGRR